MILGRPKMPYIVEDVVMDAKWRLPKLETAAMEIYKTVRPTSVWARFRLSDIVLLNKLICENPNNLPTQPQVMLQKGVIYTVPADAEDSPPFNLLIDVIADKWSEAPPHGVELFWAGTAQRTL